MPEVNNDIPSPEDIELRAQLYIDSEVEAHKEGEQMPSQHFPHLVVGDISPTQVRMKKSGSSLFAAISVAAYSIGATTSAQGLYDQLSRYSGAPKSTSADSPKNLEETLYPLRRHIYSPLYGAVAINQLIQRTFNPNADLAKLTMSNVANAINEGGVVITPIRPGGIFKDRKPTLGRVYWSAITGYREVTQELDVEHADLPANSPENGQIEFAVAMAIGESVFSNFQTETELAQRLNIGTYSRVVSEAVKI